VTPQGKVAAVTGGSRSVGNLRSFSAITVRGTVFATNHRLLVSALCMMPFRTSLRMLSLC